jgi:serine/threonine protein kinase
LDALVGKVKQTGKNLTTKITADKLQKIWNKAGSPTDSNAVADLLRTAGVSDEILAPVYKSMKVKHWRTIFYQILSVLAIIQTKYPSFRHNDMKANNILIHNIDVDENNKKYLYKINNQTYIVPNIGFQTKLWDFDFACIPGIVDNSKVDAEWTDKINVKPEQNRYYDIHYFLNTLTRKGFFPEFWTADEIPEKVRDFVKRVVPDKYQNGKLVSERGRILVNDEYLTPDEILKNDKFFKIMRK